MVDLTKDEGCARDQLFGTDRLARAHFRSPRCHLHQTFRVDKCPAEGSRPRLVIGGADRGRRVAHARVETRLHKCRLHLLPPAVHVRSWPGANRSLIDCHETVSRSPRLPPSRHTFDLRDSDRSPSPLFLAPVHCPCHYSSTRRVLYRPLSSVRRLRT